METRKAAAQRLDRILKTLRSEGEPARPGLDYRNPWQLLVATVLSAQTTDARVNLVTPGLFSRFPEPDDLAGADAGEVEEIIRTIGLYRNKARNIVALARIIRDLHDGEVPAEREALEALPGVGRKTASVVLSQAFGQPAFAVDTHVGRIGHRLGFATSSAPLEVEKALTSLIPPREWGEAHLLLIRHGRRTCHSRKPACPQCPVSADCPWPHKTVS